MDIACVQLKHTSNGRQVGHWRSVRMGLFLHFLTARFQLLWPKLDSLGLTVRFFPSSVASPYCSNPMQSLVRTNTNAWSGRMHRGVDWSAVSYTALQSTSFPSGASQAPLAIDQRLGTPSRARRYPDDMYSYREVRQDKPASP